MKVYDLIYIILLSALVGCAGIRGSGGTPDEEPVTTQSNKVFKGKVSQVDVEANVNVLALAISKPRTISLLSNMRMV